jgi:hypothetical protein
MFPLTRKVPHSLNCAWEFGIEQAPRSIQVPYVNP